MPSAIRQFVAPAISIATLFAHGCGMSAPDVAEIGNITPDFRLTEVNSNNAVSSDSLGGEVVVINFWSTSCVNCLKEIDHLNRLNDVGNVRVIGIALDDDADRVSSTIQARNINYEVAMGTPAVFEQFDGYAIPYTVVIDDAKVVRRMVSGTMEYEELLETVQQLKPTATAMTSKTNNPDIRS